MTVAIQTVGNPQIIFNYLAQKNYKNQLITVNINNMNNQSTKRIVSKGSVEEKQEEKWLIIKFNNYAQWSLE